MKKMLFALPVLGASMGAFAEDAAGAVSTALTATTAAGSQALGAVQTSLGTWVSTAVPMIASIMAGFLGFWLIRLVFRLIKGTAAAK